MKRIWEDAEEKMKKRGVIEEGKKEGGKEEKKEKRREGDWGKSR